MHTLMGTPAILELWPQMMPQSLIVDICRICGERRTFNRGCRRAQRTATSKRLNAGQPLNMGSPFALCFPHFGRICARVPTPFGTVMSGTVQSVGGAAGTTWDGCLGVYPHYFMPTVCWCMGRVWRPSCASVGAVQRVAHRIQSKELCTSQTKIQYGLQNAGSSACGSGYTPQAVSNIWLLLVAHVILCFAPYHSIIYNMNHHQFDYTGGGGDFVWRQFREEKISAHLHFFVQGHQTRETSTALIVKKCGLFCTRTKLTNILDDDHILTPKRAR